MLPFRDQDCIALEQLELNNPHHPLPNTSYFPFHQLDGFHDLLFAADGGALTAPAWPSVPLVDSLPVQLQPQSVVMTSVGGSGGYKRPMRKGRHSKICTAAGPRDRRMRLSIDVARSFFRLQDMLGFDKASKTVQWLLTMSKTAIKELARSVSSASKNVCSSSSDRSPNSESSTLACEASSSINKAAAAEAAAGSKAKKTRAKKEGIKATKTKPEFHSAQARELRAKARERARERTKEKQRNMTTNAAIDFDAIKDEAGLQDLKSLLEFANDDGGQVMNTGSEEHYQYPMTGGPPPPVLIPILGSGPALLPPPMTVAAATANNNASGNIYKEQWEMEALSLYYRSLQAAFSNYPN